LNFEDALRIQFSGTSGSHSTPILVPDLEGRHYKLLSLLYEAVEDAFGIFINILPSSFIYIHL